MCTSTGGTDLLRILDWRIQTKCLVHFPSRVLVCQSRCLFKLSSRILEWRRQTNVQATNNADELSIHCYPIWVKLLCQTIQ